MRGRYLGRHLGQRTAPISWRQLNTYTVHDGLADDQVRVIEKDRAGNLWIATHGGLSQFRDGRFKTYTSRDGLSEDSIFALRADSEGSLWIGTWGGGLNRLRDGRFTSYSTRDGLPCDTICEILEDGEGNLWMGSVMGIFRVRKADLDAFDRGSVRSISSSSYDHGRRHELRPVQSRDAARRLPHGGWSSLVCHHRRHGHAGSDASCR